MEKKERTLKEDQEPNFILYDMEIQAAFARMCQNFQPHADCPDSLQENWLIIDNDTGEIIPSKFKDEV